MKILPSYDCHFSSAKTPEEICSSLQSVAPQPKKGFFQPVSGEFTGTVTPSCFKIIQNISYRNSFLPVITGCIQATENGSEIAVQMRLYPAAACFSMVWLGFIAFFILCGLFCAYVEGIPAALPLLCASAGMFTLVQALMRLAFFLPAKKALQRLKELLC